MIMLFALTYHSRRDNVCCWFTDYVLQTHTGSIACLKPGSKGCLNKATCLSCV
jgi:hypothetical protein